MRRRNNTIRFTRIFAVLLAVLLLGSSIAYADGPKVFHYVALGDSLTAGYEPWMKEHWEQTQEFPVPYGFVERVHEQALYYGRTEVHNYGIIGLTSLGFVHQLQAVKDETRLPTANLQERILDPRTDDILSKVAEIQANIKLADLITITIGANDFMELFKSYTDKTKIVSEELQTIVNERLAVYKENLIQSLEIIYALNPDVAIVIADQYQPYPKLGDPTIFTALDGFNKQLTVALEEVVQQFTEAEYNIQIAYLGERFIGKELQFVNINLVEQEKSDPHPRQAGFEEIAKAFSEVIWEGYSIVTSKDPIGIVVNGKELQTEFKPILENGTTYVPVREYVEALGGTVEWDQATKSAIANFNGIIVRYQANSNVIEVNGEEVSMKASVRLVQVNLNDTNLKTYVPLRALAEDGLQLDVQYVQKSNTAYINP